MAHQTGPISYWPPGMERFRVRKEEFLHASSLVIAAAVAVATMTSAASIGSAQTQNGPHQRANVHHAYTYELAPNPYYMARTITVLMARIITARTPWCRSLMLPGQQSVPPSR